MNTVVQREIEKSGGDFTSFEMIPGMKAVEQELMRLLSNGESAVADLCRYVVNAGGKRIRPLLVLCSGQCFGKLNAELIKTATAAELIHTASLVHDDIIDNSFVRRNQPTINSLRGNHTAVLAGDYLFAEAFAILSTGRLSRCMKLLVEAIKEMCDGEIRQGTDLNNYSVTEDEYLSRIYKKTGALITSCCEAGAIVGGGSKEGISALREYGKNLGYAFQIIDDLLDFVGSSKQTGKPVALDLTQGNITLPVILLLRSSYCDSSVREIIEKGKVSKGEFASLQAVMKKAGILLDTFIRAASYVEQAQKSLETLPQSFFRDFLFNVADMILARER
jgi:heptaprenyl diphosphate synthase